MQSVKWLERDDFLDYASSRTFAERRALEAHIAARHNDEPTYYLPGFCRVCDQSVELLVDRQSYARQVGGVWVPNWRERLVCGGCELNNRQRAVASALKDLIAAADNPPRIYMMEEIGGFAQWIRGAYPELDITGSEYFGPEAAPGEIRDGWRHEDAENLSFGDESMSIVISAEVLEHVNEPLRALAEIHRVLAPGGHLLLTVPFDVNRLANSRRARLVDGEVQHLVAEPAYHGNPLSPDGSLVFTDFGWQLLSQMRSLGFADASIRFHWSFEYGHLGPVPIYMQASRPLPSGVEHDPRSAQRERPGP